jgi:hypothetical protein
LTVVDAFLSIEAPHKSLGNIENGTRFHALFHQIHSTSLNMWTTLFIAHRHYEKSTTKI